MLNKGTVLSNIDFSSFYKTLIPSLKDTGKDQALGRCLFHDDHIRAYRLTSKKGGITAFLAELKGMSSNSTKT